MTEHQDYTTELACALNGYRALIIPGLHNADANHWQTHWEHRIPGARRILLHDWHSPNWIKWRNSIIASLIAIDEPVVLIAEGFGALAAASVAAEYPGKIIAALLVNPADADQFDVRKKLPKHILPVPTRVICNEAKDEGKSAYLALLWSADFAYINNQENPIFWPEAIDELQDLVGKTLRHNDIMKLRNRHSFRHPHQYQSGFSTAMAI